MVGLRAKPSWRGGVEGKAKLAGLKAKPSWRGGVEAKAELARRS